MYGKEHARIAHYQDANLANTVRIQTMRVVGIGSQIGSL